MATPAHTTILSKPSIVQEQSPLFKVLPAEIRSHIYKFVLTDYPDPSSDKRYDEQTCYTRPSYFAPRKSDMSLLSTCRAVYAECWFLPFLLREQVFWLTDQTRAPPEFNVEWAWNKLGTRLQHIHKVCGGGPAGDDVAIDGLRVFAQMYVIEEGRLARLLAMPHLHPRRLVLTIRHADWWFWESDQPLRFEADWLQAVCGVMPDSIREVSIELESLERKKSQVDSIASQMRKKWVFKTKNGSALYADAREGEGVTPVHRWSGTSSWHNFRWTRDETEEGRIDYYMATVTFRPEHLVLRSGGSISDTAKHCAENDSFRPEQLRLGVSPSRVTEYASGRTHRPSNCGKKRAVGRRP